MKVDVVAQANNPGTASFQGPTDSPRRILVAEDDGDIRRLNTEVLLSSGYHVDAAEHGAAAWQRLQLKSYHLLVTDNDMPMLTGVDLLKKVYAARMDLPVIMATGTVPTEEFTRHPWLLPAAMLIKPYTIDELVGTVRKVLSTGDGSRTETAPPPVRQSQPTIEDWRILLVSLRRNET